MHAGPLSAIFLVMLILALHTKTGFFNPYIFSKFWLPCYIPHGKMLGNMLVLDGTDG